MSGGHFEYLDQKLAREMFGWDIDICYGEKGFSKVNKAGAINPLQDREISKLTWDLLCVIYSFVPHLYLLICNNRNYKLTWDLLCVIYSFDYYISGDTDEEQYFEDLKYFKDKWLKPGRKETAKRLIDEECNELRKELYKELGISEKEEN